MTLISSDAAPAHLGHCAGFNPRQPLVEAGKVVAVEEAEESLCEVARLGNRWLDATERFHEAFAVVRFGLGGFAVLRAEQPELLSRTPEQRLFARKAA